MSVVFEAAVVLRSRTAAEYLDAFKMRGLFVEVGELVAFVPDLQRQTPGMVSSVASELSRLCGRAAAIYFETELPVAKLSSSMQVKFMRNTLPGQKSGSCSMRTETPTWLVPGFFQPNLRPKTKHSALSQRSIVLWLRWETIKRRLENSFVQ